MISTQNERVVPTRARTRTYSESVERLNRMSVQKHYQAYRDVDWDAPEHQVERTDPRFALRADSPLGQTAFYRSLPRATQAELGLDMTCQVLKYGIGFESTFSRGLLEFAYSRPNRDVTHRYALHEVIEEAEHSLMFQEFINRSGSDPTPVSALEAFVDRRIARAGATFPELFFCCVLAGEQFIDHDNRAYLRGDHQHPLLARIMQYHVTEEARHVHFAERFLDEHLPALSAPRRRFLEWLLPKVLRDAQRMMLSPAPQIVKRYGIPTQTLREAYGPGSEHRAQVERVARSIFVLLGRDYAERTRVFPEG